MNLLKEKLFFWLGASFIVLGVAMTIYSSGQFALVLKSAWTRWEYSERYKARSGLVVNVVVAFLGLGLIAIMLLG